MTSHDDSFDGGSGSSLETLMPLVYDELRAIAGSYLRGSGSHTLQPTALVHEAFVKLGRGRKEWVSREHFMSTAATAMRQVLIDHARRKNADKRGGSSGPRVPLGGVEKDQPAQELSIEEIDALLTQLAAADSRSARVAEMRIFAGMTNEEIAKVLEVSRSAVSNDWQFGRAWLAARVLGARHG